MHTLINSSLRCPVAWSSWRQLRTSSGTRSSSKRGAWACLKRSFRPGSTSSPHNWLDSSPPGRSEQRQLSRKRASSAVISMPRDASSRHYKSSSMRSGRLAKHWPGRWKGCSSTKEDRRRGESQKASKQVQIDVSNSFSYEREPGVFVLALLLC